MIKLQSISDAVGFGSATRHGGLQWSVALGWIGLIWYSTVTTVCALGYYKLYFIPWPSNSALLELNRRLIVYLRAVLIKPLPLIDGNTVLDALGNPTQQPRRTHLMSPSFDRSKASNRTCTTAWPLRFAKNTPATSLLYAFVCLPEVTRRTQP